VYQTFNVKIILNGLLVRVGCQYLTFRSVDDFADTLKEYLANPQKTIDWYLNKSWGKISNDAVVCQVGYPASEEPDMGDGHLGAVYPNRPRDREEQETVSTDDSRLAKSFERLLGTEPPPLTNR